jgi:archaellum component FlaG (FlaF/FlaG flagellin family)
MRKLLTLAVLAGLGLAARPARAQLIISAPIAENQATQQAGHQGFLTALKGLGNAIMKDGNDTQSVIKSLEDQTASMHEEWYTSLLKISSVVANYQQVNRIWDYQTRTLSLYTQNIGQLRQSPYLTPAQVQGMVRGYTVLITENAGLLDDLTTILTPGQVKMTDAQRLKFINRIAEKAAHQYQLVAYFTRRNQALASQQGQAAHDSQTLKKLYGLP